MENINNQSNNLNKTQSNNTDSFLGTNDLLKNNTNSISNSSQNNKNALLIVFVVIFFICCCCLVTLGITVFTGALGIQSFFNAIEKEFTSNQNQNQTKDENNSNINENDSSDSTGVPNDLFGGVFVNGGQLPKDLPSNVPIYKGKYRILAPSTFKSDDSSISISFVLEIIDNKNLEDIINQYKKLIENSDWEISNQGSFLGVSNLELVNKNNKKETVKLTFMKGGIVKDQNNISVSYSYAKLESK